jgi:hypothetical protein
MNSGLAKYSNPLSFRQFSWAHSQAKFTVRAEANELQHGVIWLAINQHQIRLDVAISVVFPVACQRVVAVLLSQWLIIRQNHEDRDEITL